MWGITVTVQASPCCYLQLLCPSLHHCLFSRTSTALLYVCPGLHCLGHGIHFKFLTTELSGPLCCAAIILYFCCPFGLPLSRTMIPHLPSPQISSTLLPSWVWAHDLYAYLIKKQTNKRSIQKWISFFIHLHPHPYALPSLLSWWTFLPTYMRPALP